MNECSMKGLEDLFITWFCRFDRQREEDDKAEKAHFGLFHSKFYAQFCFSPQITRVGRLIA